MKPAIGAVDLRLLQGSKFTSTDFLRKSSFFFIVKQGDAVLSRSKNVICCDNPIWNQVLTFLVSSEDSLTLELHLRKYLALRGQGS